MQLEVAGRGDPIVLVPGNLTGVLSFAAHSNKLAPTREVVRAQPLCVQLALEDRALFPGYDINAESDALAEALDAHGSFGPIDLVGWSYGGLVALAFALDRPDRVRTLTLVEPSAFWVLPDYGRSEPAIRKLEALERRWANGLSEDDLAEFLVDFGFVADAQPLRQNPRWPIWARHRQALASSVYEFEHKDDVARVRAFEKPVLLVVGEGTELGFRLVIDALAKELPRARVVELPGGHAAPVLSMDRFLEAVLAFQAATGSE